MKSVANQIVRSQSHPVMIEVVRAAGRAFDDWFSVADETYRELWGDDGSASLHHELLTELTKSTEDDNLALLARTDDGSAAAAGWLSLPVSGNLHWAEAKVFVLAEHRRAGIGTALIADLERRAAAAGRTTLAGELSHPGSTTDTAAEAFLHRHGYTPALAETRRDLAVPVDPATLAELERSCRPYAQGYTVRTWADRCPDDLVDGLAALEQRMVTDAPSGEMDLAEEPWDAARIRAGEALMRAQDRTSLWSGALSADGQLVAFTDLRRPNAKPARAFQWDTLVHAGHRGHRLGTLVKIANLHALAVAWPQTTAITTHNAGSNGPMIAVNEALGFQVVGSLTTWQKGRAPGENLL